MKNITDYLVDEGSYEEDVLLGINLFDCFAISTFKCDELHHHLWAV
jgi:hypothetical protein